MSRCIPIAVLVAGVAALQSPDHGAALIEKGADSGTGRGTDRQTPEELGFTSDGDMAVDVGSSIVHFTTEYCLDLGAKGFPLPVFDMMQEANWDAHTYFEQLQAKGYAEDALQMTGPQDAMLKTDCMKENFRGKTKHIFVGDSQMMTLRNAFHRHNKCPEIWWTNTSKALALRRVQKVDLMFKGRLHSTTEQAPQDIMPKGCSEEGIASYIYWDAWAQPEIPIRDIKRELEQLGLSTKEGDNVVVWIGSNYIKATRRASVVLEAREKLHELGVKMVWDSPTFQDAAIMAATSSDDFGRDASNEIPIIFSAINQRKARGELGSNEYRTERDLIHQGLEIAMTKRWQLTNRYRGLQCDGMHTDVRGRDPLFYSTACPAGEQDYGSSVFCNWVEPFQPGIEGSCPQATGLDDMVLQSGLYAMCNTHTKPFCYQHIGAKIR